MKEYRTMIFVSQNIYEKIELYRQFLEKSEFGTGLDHAIFLAEDSVEDFSSTELNNVENFVYLFGVISKEEYKRQYDLIERKRKTYQNATHYMLYCHDKREEEKYDISRPASNSVNDTFAIEILDEELPGYVEDAEMKAELNYIKLVVLALAICKFNETGSRAMFKYYYMCANIKLDYKNVYYAIMCVLCNDADLINEKEREIKKNKELIARLKDKEECICEGKFDDSEIVLKDVGLKSKFSEYKSTEVLQRELERAYRVGRESIDESIKHNIDVARSALAVEERYNDDLMIVVKDNHIEFESSRDSRYKQDYMTFVVPKTPAEKQEVYPTDLLKRPVQSVNVDSVELRALLPLAREFEKNRKFNPGITILTSCCVAVLFLAVNGLLYHLRYVTSGAGNITAKDMMMVLAVPVMALLLTGITGMIVNFIRFLYSKSVFKNAFNILRDFLDKRQEIGDKIKDYINKYLTVYYNYHIKHSRIDDLLDKNITLDGEIKRIREKVSPANRVADIVCFLNGEKICIPKIKTDRFENEDSLSMKKFLESEIKVNTKVSCSDKTICTVTPWAEKIAYEMGNMNAGGVK